VAHRAFITSEPARVGDRLRSAAPAIGVAFIVVLAGWFLLRPSAPPVEATLPVASSAGAAAGALQPATPTSGGSANSTTSTTEAEPELVVQAAGAVEHPGVYRLAAGSRIVDLVEAAGGLRSTADRQRINLAAPVVDGERVWLPQRGERGVPEVVAGANAPVAPAGTGAAPDPGGPGGGSGPTPGTPVDINTADAAALDALPGVGPATAAAILAQRQAVGGFRSVEDLLEVRGIGEAKLAQLRPLVRV
jgi:competence protein ComEA